MINYQVDECLDCKRLVRACSEEGRVNVRRCPRRFKACDDPELLHDVLPSDWTLMTTDRVIHLEHADSFPAEHSGILIVATSNPTRTIQIRTVLSILRRFKFALADWHLISLRNSVLEISEDQAQVWRVADGSAVRIGIVEFNSTGWQDELRALLTQNASPAQGV